MKTILLFLLILAADLSALAQGQKLPMYAGTNYPYQKIADPQNQPSLEYFPPDAKAKNGAAVLILPGGGYGEVDMEADGYPTANWLAQNGFSAFVLRYRLPDSSRQTQPYWVPMTDALTAIRFIRDNAATLGFNPAKVGVIGYSAGGHLAASLCDLVDQHPDADDKDRPAFAVLVYPVITMVGPNAHVNSHRRLLSRKSPAYLDSLFSLQFHVSPLTPPTYLVHSQDDAAVPVDNTLMYYEALRKAGVPARLNLYPTGGHAYSLGAMNGKAAADTKAPQWTPGCLSWLQEQAKQ